MSPAANSAEAAAASQGVTRRVSSKKTVGLAILAICASLMPGRRGRQCGAPEPDLLELAPPQPGQSNAFEPNGEYADYRVNASLHGRYLATILATAILRHTREAPN